MKLYHQEGGKCHQHTNSWKRRHLTLLGKITIIKSLIVSKIFYPLNFLDPPNGYTQKCNSIFFKFIWGKQNLVKRKTLTANISKGDLIMIDIESQMSACRATWIHKIINSDGDWAFLGKNYIEQFGQNQLILKTNFCNSKYLPNIKSILLFYQNIILSFNRSKQFTTICDEQSLLDQVLWGNMHFLHEPSVPNQKQTLFFKRWIESGLIYL